MNLSVKLGPVTSIPSGGSSVPGSHSYHYGISHTGHMSNKGQNHGPCWSYKDAMRDLELPGPVLGFAASWFLKLSNVLEAPDHKQAMSLFGAALLVPVSMLSQRQIH